MNFIKNLLLISCVPISTNVLAANCNNGSTNLQATEFWVPSGYSLVSQNDGVCLYKKMELKHIFRLLI